MIEITESCFLNAYSEFKSIIEVKSKTELIDFKNNVFIDKQENYKYAVLEQAKGGLLRHTWKESDIGSGKILNSIKKSIQTSVIYKFEKHDNNLIDWRKKDNFNKLKATNINEKLFFDFFKSKIKNDIAFEKFEEINFSYQLIAYLFFIKNPQKFLPISQERFDKIFHALNINFKTSHNCSWENYSEYNNIIKSFKTYLSKQFQGIELLDAHSFLWIYGYKFETSKEKPIIVKANTSIKAENKKPKQKLYQPKKVINIDTLPEVLTEIDYIELHKKLMLIGNLAEEIVLKIEVEFVQNNFPELLKKVRSVANNPKLGFDILSIDENGKQKQIEVKAISTNKNSKSFILTRNELQKSKEYSNYYIYCVTNLKSDYPEIMRIKNPNLENEDIFSLKPLTYKVTFE